MPENSAFTRVVELYEHMGLNYDGAPRMLSEDLALQRMGMMGEELEEYINSDNIVDQYDALIDLIVFALGTIHLQGLPFSPGFNIVMDANMKKQPGVTKRGHDNDLAKPEGWEPPEDKLNDMIRHVATLHWAGGPINKLKPESRVVEASVSFRKTTAPPDPDLTPKEEKSGPDLDPSASVSLKWDDGKAPIHLVPQQAIAEMAWIFQYGAQKYGEWNWLESEGTPSKGRVFSSILRHLYAWWLGEDHDEESGLHHLAHAASQLLILITYTLRGMGDDDRPKLSE
jgi:predicted HAD superfamily Cof-like phosphohydrolase